MGLERSDGVPGRVTSSWQGPGRREVRFSTGVSDNLYRVHPPLT